MPERRAILVLQALSPSEKDRLGFERELLRYIDKLMLELKTKVRRNEERLAKEFIPMVGIDDQVGHGFTWHGL